MPKFGRQSNKKLDQCHEKLQTLFKAVVDHFDCSIICGFRDEENQNKFFELRKTKLRFPFSKHNKNPSMAVDVAPYPIDWADKERFYYFGGFVMGMAASMGIKIRYGGDWNQDNQVKDQEFRDLVHFEFIE